MNKIEESHFMDFLNSEGCYELYFKNIRLQSTKEIYYDYLFNSPYSLISGIFTWSETSEGNRFWATINTNWKTYIDNIKYIYEFSNKDPKFKLFIRFLKENDCYNQYFNNLMMKWKYKYMPLRCLIIDGFDWGRTKEGLVFWSKLSKKWTETYDRYEFLHKNRIA